MPKDSLEQDEIKSLLKSVIDHFDKEDRDVRERQIRHWHRLKLYWNNFSQVYWSEVNHDYKIYNRDVSSGPDDQDYYDRPINVYRAFLETIIAALSVQIPAVSCVPEDADNPFDLSTAKAGSKMSEQVYKHNNVILLWLQALYVYCTEGLIACYLYSKEDKKYGTYEEKQFKDEETDAYVCPNCGRELDEDVFAEASLLKVSQEDKFDPDNEDVELERLSDEYNETNEPNKLICPECSVAIDSNLQKTKLTINRFVGTKTKPKSRIRLEVYGGLYIKIANYAKKQEDTPYLKFAYETHYANAMEKYPDLRDRIPRGGGGNSYDYYEEYGRLSPQYRGEYPENNVTVANWWLRCASFNVLDDDGYNKLKKKFPDGAKAVLVNDVCVDYENESLDDHWSLTHNPLSDYLNHDPLGELLTNVQDIVNDLISLSLQTIEHGIAQTWADPAVVDFAAQRQIEAAPGTITPVKQVAANKSISEGFYSTKSAALSPEVFNFYRIIQELGQFVSGALPSLFGGNPTSGSTSRTASEYSMSRSMALQRLQTPWKMLTVWWKDIFGKVIPMYMKNIVEDERIVEKDELGNFINVFIRKSELAGKIGEVELEASDQLPITDEQQREIIMELMSMNNQEVMQSLILPDNISFLRKVIKIPQFKLPSEDDIQKQLEEINELINSEPIVIPPSPEELLQLGIEEQEPIELPSVEIDPLVDNHPVEADVCRSWLVSDAGRLAKKENPAGYRNVLLHMKMHMDIVNQQMMEQAMIQQEETPKQNSGQPSRPEKPTRKESNVRTPIR